MKVFLIRIYRQVTILLSLIIVFIAIILSLARVFTPFISNHQDALSAHISQAIKQPVEIAQIETAWHGFDPVLRLHDIVLLNPTNHQPEITIGTADFGINIWRSLAKWQIEPGLIAISSVKLNILENTDHEFIIKGIYALPPFHLFGQPNKSNPLLEKIFQIGHIYLDDVSINLQRSNQTAMSIVSINNFNLELENANESHRIWGNFNIKQKEKPALLRFVTNIEGNIGTSKSALKTELYVNAMNIELGQWLQSFHPYGLVLKQGQADIEMWLAWRQSKLQSVVAQFTSRSVLIKQEATSANLKLGLLKADANWHALRHGGWSLTGANIQVMADNENWPLTQLYIEEPALQSKQQVFYLSYVRLDPLLPFLQNLPVVPEKLQQLSQQLQPRGVITSFLIRRKSQAANSFLVSGHFHNITVNAWQHIPAVKDLSGQVVFSSTRGRMLVNSQNITVNFGSLFNNPLFFQQFQTQLIWQKQAKRWLIKAAPIYGFNNDIGVHGEMALTLDESKNPIINAILGFSKFDVTNLTKYLPEKIMSPKLTQWLTQSVKSGVATYTTILLRGPLKAFPFDNKEGIFAVNSNFEKLNLTYAPNWPPILDLKGNLKVVGRQIFIDAKSGKIINTPIKQISVEIPYIGHQQPEMVLINSELTGKLSNALTFLKTGPLKEKVGKNLENLQLEGPMNLQLGLAIPLKDTKGHIKVSGFITTLNALLTVPRWGIQIKNLSGQFHFTQDALYARAMEGILFDYPVLLNVTTVSDKQAHPATLIEAIGKADMHQISQQFHVPVSSYIQGVSSYQAYLVLRHAELSNILNITTNLQGTAITLPPPLSKKTAKTMPLTLSMHFNPLQITFNYADILNGALSFRKTNGGTRFYSGELLFGENAANFQQKPGLLISGELQDFNWADWFPFINDMTAQKAKALATNSNIKANNTIRYINLNMHKIHIFDQTFLNTQVQVIPQKKYWLANLIGENVDGHIQIPNNKKQGILWAQFNRLYLLKDAVVTSKNTLKPTQLPPLQINIADFRYGDINFGTLNLLTKPSSNGLLIRHFELSSPVLNLTLTGNWQENTRDMYTSIQGTLLSNNLASVLQAWQLPQFLDSSDAKIKFALSWPSRPFAAKLKDVSGNINLDMENGRIIDIGAKANADLNIGRILTILSIQSIPRRLILDFSDLTKDGFSFDSWRGDFIINKGIAATNNTRVKGLVADLALSGNMNLTAETLNFIVKVTPHITANLPVIATIAGGPIAGVATLVANQLLSPALNKLVTRYYSIKGSWHQPTIQQLIPVNKT